jgi:hypothetical protein
MKSLEELLGHSEKVLWKGKPSKIAYVCWRAHNSHPRLEALKNYQMVNSFSKSE